MVLRKGVKLIVRRDFRSIRGKRVLEIGCGSWDYAKRIIEKNNVWLGLDVASGIATHLGSVKSIPFFDDVFDIVLVNQSMEHWFEYGVSFEEGLKEIHRVLKPGGKLMINAPAGNHGHPIFLGGSSKRIKKLFSKEDWEIIKFERVIPWTRIEGWKQISNKGFWSRVKYPDFLIGKAVWIKGSHIINIHAKKRFWLGKTKQKKRKVLPIMLRFAKELI